jgi:hypothetical protein
LREDLNPHTDIGILKSLWGRSADGRWKITALKGLMLKPLPGSDPTFFRIESQMELMTERPGSNIHGIFGAFGSTDFLVGQSILPVVAWADGERAMRCIGTAYVISCTGYLITAAHILLDPVERGYGDVVREGNLLQTGRGLNMGVVVPLNPIFGLRGYRFFGFERAHFWGEWKESPLFHVDDRFHYQTDVAVCKIAEMPTGVAHQPLNLSLGPVRVGDRVYALGYALMDDIPIEYRSEVPSIPEFAHDIWVSVGDVMNVYPKNLTRKDVPAPGPCFDFSAKIPGKMSGGPILGGDGAAVRGVVSRSFSRENHAFGALLAPALHFPLGDDQTLKTLMEAGTEGIPRVQGPGL